VSDPKEHALKLDITREPASMERHAWVQIPIMVDVNGRPHQVPEWGLAGVAVQPFQDRPPAVGTPVTLHMGLPSNDSDISFDVPGIVESWSEPERRLVIGFLGLKLRERELMTEFIAAHAGERHVTKPQGDQMNDVDSLAHHALPNGSRDVQELPLAAQLHASPDVVSAKAVTAREPAARVRPLKQILQRATKSAVIGSGYGLLGLAVVGYLGYASYRHLTWLDVGGAALAAPVESILSMGDGAVRWTSFKPGDKVKAGDVVLNIFDNVLEREIEQAAIAVREREAKVTFLKRRLEYERVRMVGLGQVSNQKSLQILAEIEGMRAKLKSANTERRQLSAATPGPLAQVRQRIVGLQQAMALKELELKGRAALADKTDGRMALVGQQLVGDSGTLEAQLELDEAEVQLAEERHQAFLDQRDRLAVRAPFEGTLRQLTRYDTANIKRGDVAAVIEQSGDRGVRAVLRQDQALRLAVGSKAEVRVPATGQTFAATVAEIEPVSWSMGGAGSHGETTKASSSALRQNAEESQLIVRLAFANPRLLDNQQTYRSGLPVVALIQTGTAVSTTAATVTAAAEDAASVVSSVGTNLWQRTAAVAGNARVAIAPRIDNTTRHLRDISRRTADAVAESSRVWRAKVVEQFSSWKQRLEQAAAEANNTTGRRG
jgi:multidrug resistance efflux pump